MRVLRARFAACCAAAQVQLRCAPRQPPPHHLNSLQAEKEGKHAAVFSPSGEQYTGEWRANRRHGARDRAACCLERLPRNLRARTQPETC